MADYLYRGILNGYEVRFAYALTTDTCNSAVLSHNCDPVSAHILSRALTAGVMISPLLNEDERQTIHWNYRGAISSLVVDVGANAGIRGFINPTNLSELAETQDDLFGGDCDLKVMKSNTRALLNNSTLESIFQDPVADLSHFYCLSEQVESAMCAMVGFNPDPAQPVALAQGLLLQALPGCDLEQFDRIRQNLESSKLRDMLKEQPAHDNWFELLLQTAIEGESIDYSPDIYFAGTPAFRCSCSPEKLLSAIRTLPQEQRQDVLDKQESLTVVCHFCNQRHTIPYAQLRDAFGAAE